MYFYTTFPPDFHSALPEPRDILCNTTGGLFTPTCSEPPLASRALLPSTQHKQVHLYAKE